jgi:hypothetical protein
VSAGTLRARHVRKTWLVTGALTLDQPSVLQLRLAGTTIAAGSVAGDTRTGRPHATLVVSADGRIALQLRTAKRPKRLDVVATNVDGTATTLTLPIR